MALVASVLLAPDDNRRPRGERAFDLAMLIIVSTVGVLCAQYTRAFDERIEPRRGNAPPAHRAPRRPAGGRRRVRRRRVRRALLQRLVHVHRQGDGREHHAAGTGDLPRRGVTRTGTRRSCLWQQFRNHVEHVGWEKLWQEIRDALKDKTAEAARELEMEDQELTPANIRRAHRKLALANHPDKVAGKGKAAEAEAKEREEKMKRLNNAKELLLKRLAESD